MRILALLITLSLLTGCTGVVLPPAPSPSPTSTLTPTPLPPPTVTQTPLPYALQPVVDAGLRFLEAQYNPDYGLLQESPDIGARRYFLANDALLAAYVFELYGREELASRLRATLSRYGVKGNGFIEAAWGEVVRWPPLHFEDPGTLVEERGDDQIMTIRHEGPGYFYDWSAYSNLACMASVNEYNLGQMEAARRLYEIEMSTFDGRGFADEAYYRRGHVYETLGVAWCLHAGALLQLPVNEKALSILLDQQGHETGGFHTHYNANESRLADPNVETTALALLALHTLQQGPPQRVRLGFPANSGPPSP